ncbi:MAG: sensor histidine kinase [Traorella sp.]
MKTKTQNKAHSFVVDCIIHFLLFSIVLLLIYVGANYLQKVNSESYYYSINDIIELNALKKDQFDELHLYRYKNSAAMIYDENKNLLYTTDGKIASQFSKKDIDLVNNFYNGDSYYTFLELNDMETEEIRYRIQRLAFPNNYEEEAEVLYTCILDKNYQATQSSCNQEEYTEFEINIIQGYYDENHYIDKYEYKTENNEKRTLIFISTQLNTNVYQDMMHDSNRIWMLAVCFAGITIVIFSYLFSKHIKKMIAPLKEVIDAYEQGRDIDIEYSKIPSEFAKTIQSYAALLDRLTKVQKEKEEIYNERQRVIANISHDLKTPLTVIQGYSGAFIDNMVPEDKKEQYLQTIYNKTLLAADLVNSLNEYIKMEHPEFVPDFEIVDINVFIQEYFAIKYQEIENKGFNLHINLDNNHIQAEIDKKLFHRLLENLVENALKYNPEKTTIYVSTCKQEEHVELIVADDGVGIPTEIANKIFDPFITGNYARKSGQGTGLGLSIARRIVELHQGRIELSNDSEPYHSRFRIVLPLKQK